jgi:hypothetical protein
MNRIPKILSANPLGLGLSVAVAFVALSVAACDSIGGSGSPLSPTSATASASKQGKPVTTVPATITLADRVGDAITSNGSAYAAEMLGDTLEFTCCTGQIVNYDLSNVISGTGPTGTLSDPSGFFVTNVGSMAIGSTQLARAYFKTSVGSFTFDASMDAQSNSVSVTRVDANTWVVDTSAGDIAFLPHTETVPDPHNPHKTITVTTKTYYHLPFRLTGVTQ